VDIFNAQVSTDPLLRNGFNLVGYSQGGIISRGYIERYNNPPVNNFITWSAPHAGIFGIPDVSWKWIAELVGRIPYEKWIQETFSFSNYWKNPYHLEEYLNNSAYLADINNERTDKNISYKKNMMSLNNMACVFTTIDDIVVPKESGIFEFYAPNSQSYVVPLNETEFYQEDWLGIRYLDENDKFHRFSCNCSHLNYPYEVCHYVFTDFTLPFLNDTI